MRRRRLAGFGDVDEGGGAGSGSIGGGLAALLAEVGDEGEGRPSGSGGSALLYGSRHRLVGASGAALLALAAALSGTAQAAEECGPAEPGRRILCSPANYDAASDGNIFYGPDEAREGDFGVRLTGDLSVRYDRDVPGDDVLVLPDDGSDRSVEDRSRHGAVVIAPGGEDYAGDISVSSAADIATDGRGIVVYHQGASGALNLDLAGDRIEASGGKASFAIDTMHTGSGDTGIAAGGVAIEAAGENAAGISAGHRETGAVAIDLRGGRIAAAGQAQAKGVWSHHTGSGDIGIAADDVAIEVTGDQALGYFADHRGTGAIAADLRGGTIKVTGQAYGDGLWAQHNGSGDLGIAAAEIAIEAAGDLATGIGGVHGGTGAIAIDVRGGRITASGENADGIYVRRSAGGSIDIDAEDVAIEIQGTERSNGLVAVNRDGTGDISITTRNVDIEVRGEEQLDGIFIRHASADREDPLDDAGDSRIAVSGGSVVTAGADSGGIRVFHEQGGSISIDVRDATIATNGSRTTGIGAGHPGKDDGAVRIRVDGGTVTADGRDSHGISIGSFDGETGAVRAAGAGADGYRRQSVTVNGRVRSGGGSGVRLVGGGRVAIGPRGSVGAASGVAVLAEGEGAALHVDAELDGRRADEAIAGEIRNDDGRTTVAVNGVVLHDGMTGATGLRAPNGARDITLAASETVAGRVFSAADLVTGPYAPRAAVYEALPGFMLRLDKGETTGKRLRRPGSPAWVRVSGGRGSHEPDRASVGAAWDVTRFEAEAGLDFALSEAGDAVGSVALRHVGGSADVSAPTGGGRVEAAGMGGSFGVSWMSAAGWYAEGRLSVTRYETDLRADGQGRLKEGARATVRSLGVEAGRRLALGGDLHLTPRAWLVGSDVSMEGFRDAVGSRFSLEHATRVTAGAGVAAETVHEWDDGERALALSGRLGLERALGDAETAVEVSGERLGAEASGSRVVLGLGGVYRWGGWSFAGEVSASGPGSSDSSYAVSLSIGAQF